MKSFAENQYPFLSGGGELGQLTRTFDWTKTPVGSPDCWPQSLRTIVSTILASSFPMFLWWGDELVQFYNDAYRPSLGDQGKHPSALGQPGAECWPEIWPTIKPLIDQVRAGGESIWLEEQRIPIVRNGQLEEVYWTFSYSRVLDDTGQIAGVLVVCQETTRQVIHRHQQQQQLDSSEAKFEDLVTTTPAATAIFTGRDMLIQQVNAPMLAIWGKDTSVIGKTLHVAMPELEGQPFLAQLQHVFDTGEVFQQSEGVAEVIENGHPKTVWFNHAYNPLYTNDGRIYGIINTAADVTVQVVARQQLAQSEAHLHLLRDAVPAMIFYLDAQQRYQSYNQVFREWFSVGDEVIGQTVREFVGEAAYQTVQPHLADAYAGRTVHYELHAPSRMHRGRWLSIVYRPHQSPQGEVMGVIVHATNITELKQTQESLRESQVQLSNIVQQTPAPTLVVRGDDYRIAQINQPMLAFMGRGEEVIGQPLLAIMPELAGQFAWQQVQRVYREGIAFNQDEVLVPHARHGVQENIYYNVAYQPLIENGQITGVIQVAIDVTQQVVAQQALKDSQASLQSIIDLAELGSYQIDVTTNRMTKSSRTAEWYGLPRQTDVAASMNAVHKSDRERISQVLFDALRPGSSGTYQVEYTVINQQTGEPHILRMSGQVRWDAAGEPWQIEGAVVDITLQRAMQLALEEQVEQRTEELAAANEELAANVEEYAAINKELEEANSLLVRSNDNLLKFAYVASHDLQEPLRKIQQFGDLLLGQYASELGNGADYLTRMQVAANRMSTLIKDLLSFSRISTQRNTNVLVPLNQIVDITLNTLELVIAETGAIVTVDPLPTISGDPTQLGQLFQNLLSNALKFRRPGIPPVLTVRASVVAVDNLPSSIRPVRGARRYHQIDVADNGIGFEEKYLDRIFEVFQRLHGRNEFAGTGIGLAICEKVVTNHGGAITASSQPGEGATFSVYLPV